MKLDDKRRMREHKREVKRLGHKRVRARLRDALARDPDNAADAEIDFAGLSTEKLHVDR